MAELIQEQDTLNEGRVKINAAITAFNETVVEGDSSVEAAQARVDENGVPHPTLKARIDNGFEKTATHLNETNSQLTQKADKTYVEGVNKRIDNLVIPISPENTNVEVTDAHVSTYKNKVFTTIGKRFDDIESGTYYPAENLVENPVFSEGVNKWPSFLAMSSIIDGVLVLKANGKGGRIEQTIDDSQASNGHIIYYLAEVKATSNLVGLGATTLARVNHSGGDEYERLSYVRANTGTVFRVSVLDERDSDWDEVYVKAVVAIDLTFTFGEGNEPTKEDMDDLLANIPSHSLDSINLFNGKQIVEKLWDLEGREIEDGSISPKKLEDYEISKNLFDKSAITKGYYVSWDSGTLTSNPSFGASEFISVLPNTNYVRSISKVPRNGQMAFYDGNKNYLSGVVSNDPGNFKTPPNCAYVRLTVSLSELEVYQLEVGSIPTSYSPFGYKLKNLITENRSEQSAGKIYTLNDAWLEWLSGEKFPVAFLGDSTINGAGTTNYIGGVVGEDNSSPNAFPKKLEELLRTETNNDTLRIYNAGISGTHTGQNGLNNLEGWFGSGSPFSDVKMVGIGHGINDRLRSREKKSYKALFKNEIKGIIEWLLERSIQPFLLTTQATTESGVKTNHVAQYPLRSAEPIETVANEVKFELSSEYNLEIIDVNKFTERYLKYSTVPASVIIPDQLHFSNTGHLYETGLLFSHFVNNTIFIKDYEKIDYSTQRILNGVHQDWLTIPETVTSEFKLWVDFEKDDSTDISIMKTYLFIDSKKQLTLKAYKNNVESSTYVKVNDSIHQLNSLENNLGALDLGFYKLEVFSGESTRVDFKGFIIE